MGNTVPSQLCAAEAQASAAASAAYPIEKFAKRFCEMQGHGWHVSAKKDDGKIVCNECSGEDTGKYQCHREDVVVTGQRIKPGSVGLFPGKG
jgi:hypothetical protein